MPPKWEPWCLATSFSSCEGWREPSAPAKVPAACDECREQCSQLAGQEKVFAGKVPAACDELRAVQTTSLAKSIWVCGEGACGVC